MYIVSLYFRDFESDKIPCQVFGCKSVTLRTEVEYMNHLRKAHASHCDVILTKGVRWFAEIRCKSSGQSIQQSRWSNKVSNKVIRECPLFPTD